MWVWSSSYDVYEPTPTLGVNELTPMLSAEPVSIFKIMGNVCGVCKERSSVAPVAENANVLTIPRKRSRWSLRSQSSVVYPSRSMPNKRVSLSSCIVEVDESLSNSRGSLRMLGSFRSGRSVRVVMKHSESVCSERSLKSTVYKGTASTTRVRLDRQIAEKYSTLCIIGRGSFSTVLSLEDKNTGIQCALKIIKKKKLSRNGIYTELDILRKLRHPNIIRLHEAYSTRNKIYLILELATGGDLYQRLLVVGHYTETDARTVVIMILKALHYLHDIGITHRDVKMENCLFKSPDENSVVLLSDFGLAHHRSTEDEGTHFH